MQYRQQIYGRNDMVMLEKHNKIYGSLGLTEQFVFDTVKGENNVVLKNPKEGSFEKVVTNFTLQGKSQQNSTTGKNLLDYAKAKSNVNNVEIKKNGNQLSITNNNNYVAIADIPMILDVGTYYLSASSSSAVPIYRNGSWFANGILENTKKGNFKVTEKDEYRARITVQAKATVLIDSLMCSTLENAEYEPYTGGKPSPSPEYPQEIESAGLDGEIAINVGGGNLLPCEHEETVTLVKTYKFVNPLPPGVYCASVKSINGEPADIGYQFGMTYEDGTSVYSRIANINGRNLIFPKKQVVSFTMYSNTAYPESVGKTTIFTGLMLSSGTTALPYEPYKIPQSLALQTPNGLPGIQVSTGGNYTDSTGQQWVTDEIDLARGKYVQRVKKSLIQLKKYHHENSAGYRYAYIWITDEHKNYTEVLSDKFRYNANAGENFGDIAISGIRMSPRYNTLVAFEKRDLPPELIETTVYYILATPIERDLTQEEVETYKALHTNYPTTVIMNDENAGMKVTYKQLESKTKVVS